MSTNPELDIAADAAVQAIFLWEGFSVHPDVKREEPDISNFYSRFGGQIGVVSWIADFAKLAAKANAAISTYLESDWHHVDDVFEYQVTGAMGRWLRNNIDATDETFTAELNKQVSTFLNTDFPTPAAPAPHG
jgi:hypothetical protein